MARLAWPYPSQPTLSEAADFTYDRVDSLFTRLRRGYRQWRLQWRVKYVPGAKDPRRVHPDERYSWIHDIGVGFHNPPGSARWGHPR